MCGEDGVAVRWRIRQANVGRRRHDRRMVLRLEVVGGEEGRRATLHELTKLGVSSPPTAGLPDCKAHCQCEDTPFKSSIRALDRGDWQWPAPDEKQGKRFGAAALGRWRGPRKTWRLRPAEGSAHRLVEQSLKSLTTDKVYEGRWRPRFAQERAPRNGAKLEGK